MEQVEVPIADLPSRLDGLRLIQLSDFHYEGIGLSTELLAAAIAVANAAEPDFVVLTGDFVTEKSAAIHNLVPWLKQLQSRHGVYAVLGNHDNYGKRYRREIVEALTSIEIQVLWNEIAYPLGSDFAIVGLAEWRSREFDPAPVMTQLDDRTPRLVLVHNPDSAAVLRSWRVDLQLSGHTHGGQVWLPNIGNVSERMAQLYGRMPKSTQRWFPMLKPFHRSLQHWEWSQGLHAVGQNRLYINRGLGTYFPGRLSCPPEVTVITLRDSGGAGADPVG